jgi:sec-independent protein translocase protein TatC
MTATADPSVPAEGADSDGGEYQGEEMTLFEHLAELRSRLLKAGLAFAVFFVIGFAFNNVVSDILTSPYCSLPSELRVTGQIVDGQDNCKLIFTDVLGAFIVRIKAALVVAVTFGGPVIAYQIWAFVVPGLKAKEKRYAAPFVILSQLLFLAGAAFSFLIIPRGLEFLLNFGGDAFVSFLDANSYLTFLLRMMIVFGVAFEYPLIISLLVLMGLVTVESLKRFRRHAFFLSFVAASILTPQDPFTMVVLALPLAAFYEICILFAWLVGRRRAKAEAMQGEAA